MSCILGLISLEVTRSFLVIFVFTPRTRAAPPPFCLTYFSRRPFHLPRNVLFLSFSGRSSRFLHSCLKCDRHKLKHGRHQRPEGFFLVTLLPCLLNTLFFLSRAQAILLRMFCAAAIGQRLLEVKWHPQHSAPSPPLLSLDESPPASASCISSSWSPAKVRSSSSDAMLLADRSKATC